LIRYLQASHMSDQSCTKKTFKRIATVLYSYNTFFIYVKQLLKLTVIIFGY